MKLFLYLLHPETQVQITVAKIQFLCRSGQETKHGPNPPPESGKDGVEVFDGSLRRPARNQPRPTNVWDSHRRAQERLPYI
jgi:hypothetical protein